MLHRILSSGLPRLTLVLFKKGYLRSERLAAPAVFLLVVIVIFFGAASAAQAVPQPQATDFEEVLDERHWRVQEGSPDRVVHGHGGLFLRPSEEGPTALVYRYYRLREGGIREAFGDFEAHLLLEPPAGPGGFSFGLLADDAWELRIEIRSNPAGARLARRGGGGTDESSEWIPLPGSGPVGLKLIREGNRIYASMEREGERHSIGRWEGRLAPIPEFVFRAVDAFGAQSLWRLENFAIEPLISDRPTLTILPRAGTPLPGDEDLPENLRHARITGGHHEGGYLWAPGEGAALPLRLENLRTEPREVVLAYQISDFEDVPLFSEPRTLQLKIPGQGELETSLPLPDDRFGYFIVHLELLSPEGEPWRAPQTVGYGITAAPRPAEIPESSVVGMHSAPFGLLGAKHVRFWDQNGRGVHWSGIQPERDRWEWSVLDAYVQRVEAAGMTSPIIVLSMTPEWASSDTSYTTYRGRGAFSPPTNLDYWAEYCRRVAERYKGRVRYYEIWNEPNENSLKDRGFFFYAPVEKYFEMLKVAYEAVKEVDPDALILAPSGTGHFFPFLERLMEMGGGDYFDIASIHTYMTPFPPEIGYQFNNEKDYLHRVARTREILAEHGFEKPIWNTEIGYHSGPLARIAGFPLRQDVIAAEALPGRWPNWRPGWSFRATDPRRITFYHPIFHSDQSVWRGALLFPSSALPDGRGGHGTVSDGAGHRGFQSRLFRSDL